MPTPPPQQDNKGARLRTAFEHAALQRLINAIQDDEEDFSILCKALHAYCELRKQDAALEKNKRDKEKAQTPKTRTPPAPPQRAAPFGIDDRGAPNTEARFQASLRQTINDLYGTPEPTTPAPNHSPRGAPDPPHHSPRPSRGNDPSADTRTAPRPKQIVARIESG